MKKIGCALSILTVLIAGLAVRGDCNRARVIVQQPHHAVQVVHQAAVNYHHAAQAVHFVPVAISPDFYYSTNNFYQALVQAKLVAGELAQMQAPKPAIAQIQTPCPCPKTEAKVTAGNVNEKLAALISGRCLKCHQGPSAGGGLSLENLDSLPRFQRWACYASVNRGKMPKGGQAISDQEVDLFAEWAESGR